MKRILQINTTANSGSHGRIASGLGDMLIDKGYESYLAYGRTANKCSSVMIKIGGRFEMALHLVSTRLFDRHGFGSINATKSFVKEIDKIDPDIIHLHNLHGYYLNIEVLFEYLKTLDKPIVWTFHDCWPFTGHCSHFESSNCYKWRVRCYQCPNKRGYPASWWIDNSNRNFEDKKRIFSGIKSLHIVTPSVWLANHVRKSFLKDYPVNVINNGIDLQTFKPMYFGNLVSKYDLNDKKIILGVANTWKKKKAFEDFIQLSRIIDSSTQILLIGLDNKLLSKLPGNITGIKRTESIEELATYYSAADVFVNPTYADNFPTTNIEALACGTPIVTYKTGGSPETIDEKTGIIVEKGDITGINNAISQIVHCTDKYTSGQCRARAEKYYSSNERFLEYVKLYDELLASVQ